LELKQPFNAPKGQPMKNSKSVSNTVARLGAALSILLAAGCATKKAELEHVAKDWCMTIRASQVVPVYPLTEDTQPGDVFLVQVPVDRQQEIYQRRGFLPLDNHLARLNPSGYDEFYAHSFLDGNATNILPRDWIRPNGSGIYHGTNGTNTLCWQASPRAGFPSYSFSVRNGGGLSLAVPVSGVPVGLSLLASDAANGSVQISDARTLGVDTLSLYHQLRDWAATNASFLHFFGGGTDAKPNYLRVITRVYAAGKMTVTLKDASNRSAGLDVGVPKPVNLLVPELPSTNASPENAVRNFTNAFNALGDVVKAAGTVATNATGVLPGGSLRLAAASSRSVSVDETFDPPMIFGYLGFDCAIFRGGVLGPPIPTYAVLDPGFNLKGLLQQSPVYSQVLDDTIYSLMRQDKNNPRATAAVKRMDGLAEYVPNEFTSYSLSGSEAVLTAKLIAADNLHNTNGAPPYNDFHAFRGKLDGSISSLSRALKLSKFEFKDAQDQQRTVTPQTADWRNLEGVLTYYSRLRQHMTEDPKVQNAYSDTYAYFLEKLVQ
jgi:hypothetical protein